MVCTRQGSQDDGWLGAKTIRPGHPSRLPQHLDERCRHCFRRNFEPRFHGFDEPVLPAGNYIFPNRTDHQNDLAQKLEQLNAEFQMSHPVCWASDLLLAVLTHHPFLNGNGPLARLCFAYVVSGAMGPLHKCLF